MRTMLVSLLITVLGIETASAQWGTLRGRIVLDGDVPRIAPLVNGPVRGLPGNVVVPDDSLVIDPKTKGIAHVAVWLAKKPDMIHDDRIATLPKSVTMNLVGMRFEPHLLVVHNSQQLDLVNLDPAIHNALITPLKNQGVNINIAPNGAKQAVSFQSAERLPVTVRDQNYPWMGGYLLVVDHPYAAVTDRNGNYEITDLPVGEQEFKVWHERAGYLVKDAGNPKQGLILKINDGEPTVVPDIKVPLQTLTK